MAVRNVQAALKASDAAKASVNMVETPSDLHVTGKSQFIGDIPKPAGMCYISVVPSAYAHARIIGIDASSALRMSGVLTVLTAADIPGENQIGSKIKDEPLLADTEACYIGQPIAIVVAEDHEIAVQARAQVKIEYGPQELILTIRQALAARSMITSELKLANGDVEAGFAQSEFVLEGDIVNGSQEHVYFETQITRAVPGEDNEITLYSGTQAPSEVQQVCARVLGCDRKDITVDVRRLGGAFGGKESAATLWASLAGLACYQTRRPVELRLSRGDDMGWTGKRHPIESTYKVGFDRNGRINSYAVEFNGNAGAFADLTMAILQRAVLHAENAYCIPNIHVIARPMKTHLPPNTAFRGFGAPQGIFVIESVIERIALQLNKDPLEIRKVNAYREGDATPYGQPLTEVNTAPLFERLETLSKYKQACADVDQFNAGHRFVKRGVSIIPVKFGISFTTPFLNQGSALVHLYTDGSVSVSHGGVEMGQSVNTKVARVVAAESGVPLNRIRIESHNTKRTANTSPTAASTGADINANAARNAAQKIVTRLRPVAAELLQNKTASSHDPERLVFRNGLIFDPAEPNVTLTTKELVNAAWMQRVDLSAHGYHKTPGLKFDWEVGRGTPFAYFVYGCAMVEVEVDILTGNFTAKRAVIVHETGPSIDPLVDRGQIEGAFIQGMGWCTIEEVVRDDRGRTLTDSLTTYKIPSIVELPEEWIIEMVQAERQAAGVKGSKAVGEPPFIYGEAAFFAIKHAVEAVANHRVEADLRMPATPESVLNAVESLNRKVTSQ